MKRKAVTISMIFLAVLTLFKIAGDYYSEMGRGQTETPAAKKADYCIFIEIEDKTLYLLQDGKCIKEYPIASGKSGMPSPIGFWKITDKSDWGEGFGGRWMGLNVPWGKCQQEHFHQGKPL
ncbi:MAG: L,D-transpeptidase [Clostridiales bacterium]|nr:L,D-transpeptidase [Eubacteriales bacterium]MDH7567572.1 L,D-transpeptidase [Clostridiales bacterium]